MKSIFALSIAVILHFSYGHAQVQRVADSLRIIYMGQKLSDSAKLKLLSKLSFNEMGDNNLALRYAEELINLSQQVGDKRYERSGYFLRGHKLRNLGKLDSALASFITSIEIAKKQKDLKEESDGYSSIADIYSIANNHSTAGFYYRQAIESLRKSNDSSSLATALANAGDDLLKVRKYDTAMQYFSEAKLIFEAKKDSNGIVYSLGNIGVIYAKTGKTNLAEKNINEAIAILEKNQNYYPICDYLISMSDVYEEKGSIEEAINYASRSLSLAKQYKLVEQVVNASKKLSALYEKSNNETQALLYYKMHVQYRDSLYNLKTSQTMADLRLGFEMSNNEKELNRFKSQNDTQRNFLIASLLVALLAIGIVVILIKNNLHKKHSFLVLTDQKKQTEIEKAKAENALSELTRTQAQLIQSAKLASLGELTAGIAHEIQNPLNFINNFSELNTELISEAKEELENGNVHEAKLLLADINDNGEKINHHGKRADSIVKGMLQHSRKNSGHNEPTDINALCDEYLRLSYHGLRAQDKSFNASFSLDPDETIGKVNINPLDIGRVVLNLITNAFYACNERNQKEEKIRQAMLNTSPELPEEASNPPYKPTVNVTTTNLPALDGGFVEIKISDNGGGIPEEVLEKIFHPFFTTKPAGKGTGLGLSISYDIVTKGHGGKLEVETEVGKGTTFIINLPK